MAFSDPERALIAFHRFGFGPRPGDLTAMTDPRAALHAEVAQGNSLLITPEAGWAAGLGGTASNMQATFMGSDARRALQIAQAGAADAAGDPAGRSEAVAGAAPARMAALKDMAGADARILRNEALVRIRKACSARIGFLERLVAFWSNHFCVSMTKGEFARATAGSFEREAIRPHVLGRFADMLAAVERHPAMLAYLDNAQSVGPDARTNGGGLHGLNENLAREILELHTLGVGTSYTQADVTAFARVLTGWTVAGRDGRLGDPGTFTFDANTHQPGDETVAGKLYPAGGFGQGEAALADFARHPATAQHLATKLVRHFIADEPPRAAVDRIAAVFTTSDGNLRAISLALVDLPQAWDRPLTKLRNPYDLMIAIDRLLDRTLAEPWSAMGLLKQLGMPLWEPPGPNGFPDVAAAWGSPEGMKLRLDLAAQIAHGDTGDTPPMALLDHAFGDACSSETRTTVSRAESREQALALILMAPEFQRR